MSKVPAPVRGIWVQLRHKKILMPKVTRDDSDRRRTMQSDGVSARSGDYASQHEVTVVDVYDIASDVGKECELIIERYGAEAVTSLMPKVINALELLEQLAMKNEQENTIIDDLTMKVAQLENDKMEKAEYRKKFEKELEVIEEQWRNETRDLLSLVSKLQEENRKLADKATVELENESQCGHVTSPMQEASVLERLKSVIDRQRDEIKIKDKVIFDKNDEIENVISQNDRLRNNLREVRRKQSLLQQQIRQLCDERGDFLVQMQETQREVNVLRKQLGMAAKHAQDLAKSTINPNDSNRPRFTSNELKEILHERNELKAKISDLEDELSHFRPPATAECVETLTSEEDGEVQGPLPYEPDDAPWKRDAHAESGIRKFFRKLFEPSENESSSSLFPRRSISSTLSKLTLSSSQTTKNTIV